jgi:hypothetical protein
MSTPNIPTGPRKNTYVIDATLTPPLQPMVILQEAVIKDEPIDPLQMDIDEDEIEFEPERLNEEVCRFKGGLPFDLSSVSACSYLSRPKQKTISWLPV